MAGEADDGAWFSPKAYGYGAGWPLRWQGWAFLGAVIVLLWLAHRLLHGAAGTAAVVALIVAAVVIAAARTRGGWHWRWGGDR